MTTIDWRSRFTGPVPVLDADALFSDLASRLAETNALAGHGARALGLPSLGFQIDDSVAHLALDGERLDLRDGLPDDGVVVELDVATASELFDDALSPFGAIMAGRVGVVQGTGDEFAAWEPGLRAAIDARPVYTPGSLSLHDRAGNDLDLRRAFRIDDDRDEIGHFLAEAGYLHLADVFTPAEMAQVSAEMDWAIASARRDDGASWWARTDEGWYPSRLLGFNLQSPTLQELLESDRFATIGTFTDDAMVQRPPRHGDSAEGLWKKVGVRQGLSDASWHKDCSLGGHSRKCCALVVGISVTGAQRHNGELGAVAGSHRANVRSVDVRPDLDLPRVPLPTNTGDVTVHCSCTLHMSRPPVSDERRVVYSGFGLAPRSGDEVEVADGEHVRRARAALAGQAANIARAGASPGSEAFRLDE